MAFIKQPLFSQNHGPIDTVKPLLYWDWYFYFTMTYSYNLGVNSKKLDDVFAPIGEKALIFLGM